LETGISRLYVCVVPFISTPSGCGMTIERDIKRTARIVQQMKKYTVSQLIQQGTKKPMPSRIKPMLCAKVATVPTSTDYIFEIKWDGYRILSYVQKGKVRLDSRSAKDYTAKYPPVARALQALKRDVILDGEMVVFDEEGKPVFNGVQLYNGHNTPIYYYCFDVIWLDGYDLRALPLVQRRQILQTLLNGNDVLRYSESFEDGEGLLALMKEKGFEGVVAKRKDSEYMEDNRSDLWLKIPIKKIDEFVIGGWAESDKTRSFKSILFGAYDNGQFKWVGRSGGGYKTKEMPGILKELQRYEIKESPFVNEVLDTKGAKTHWMKPKLVANFEYSELTESGRIRKPAIWHGFRKDKDPKDVILPRITTLEKKGKIKPAIQR
jgi:bifunctional non-homologous end joining protein LigD